MNEQPQSSDDWPHGGEQPPATQEVIEIDEASGKVVNVHTEPNPHAQQPPATEQEWTNITVEELWEKGGSIAVKDAHNAALAAEREAREELYDSIIDALPQEFRQNSKGAVDCVRRLVAELAAEREKLKTAAGDSKHYRELFNEIRIAVRPLTHTDATKKEIIDCVKSLVQQLAAEREKREQAEKESTLFHSDKLRLIDELAAEREKYQFKANLTQEIVELRQQLLAAQSLMEHDAEVETKAYALGAQHQHKEDELVRKPLVDLLTRLQPYQTPDDAKIIAAELAKVKEGK